MPQVTIAHENHHAPRNRVVLIFAVIIVLVVSGAAYLVWRLVPSATTTVAQVDTLDAEGNYTAAMSALNSAYSRAIFKSDKVILMSRLAATSQDRGSNQQALQYFQQLNSLQPNNYSTLLNIGDMASSLGDKSVAVDAYTRALAIKKSEKPGIYWQAEINQLTQEIASQQS